MPFQTNRRILDSRKAVELSLDLNSFVAGENTIGTDQELKANECRICQNWEATAVGGMIRSKGFDEVGDGGGTYTDEGDFLIQHYEGSNDEVYGVTEGDLTILSGSVITQEDAAAFTSGTLCHGVVFNGTLWINNSDDGLRYKTIGGAIAAPTQEPVAAGNLVDKDRIYYHRLRLIAEGGDDQVLGSRAGAGNWKGAGSPWTTSNDAWSSDLPSDTQGCVPGFPSGGEISVFTEFECVVLQNMPNVTQRQIVNSHGCSAPHSIAKGNEGIYFLSKYPTLGVYLWDSVNWINLTKNHDFVDTINFGQRIFGIYKDDTYYIFYNETGSGVTYPNRMRKFNAKFGRWMERPINPDVSDNFGYPALLTRTNNELYVASSQKDKVYDIETSATDDQTIDTIAKYTTKYFSSIDFNVASGGDFPVDDVRMKLTKITIVTNGTTGTIGVKWTADRGTRTGSVSFDISATGDIINDTFTINTSLINASVPETAVTRSFSNAAVGRVFNFEITNSDTGTRPEVKRIKIHAVALDEA